ncbi:hypothetical protein QFZ27_004094 [Inquilinus ginsengisoli]|uniref:hypothetical protein n=1 Tax=Inquilinus ginsengisoli TaxID=363840 RepID=UPI003D24422A
MKSFLRCNKSIYFPIVMLFVACSVRSGSEISVSSPWEHDNYVISAGKDDQNKRINLYIENRSFIDLCIESGGWPKKGRMDDCVSEKLEVVYENRKIGFKESRCTDCFGSEDEIARNPNYCSYRIHPGKGLRGYINYEEFSEDLSGIQPEKMTLNFPYPAYVCEDWKATGQPTPLLPQ